MRMIKANPHLIGQKLRLSAVCLGCRLNQRLNVRIGQSCGKPNAVSEDFSAFDLKLPLFVF